MTKKKPGRISPSKNETARTQDNIRKLRAIAEDGEAKTAADILAEGAPLEQLAVLVGNAYEWNEQMGEQVGAPVTDLACQSGCAHCCYTQVHATVPEVLVIAARLRAVGRHDGVLTRARAAAEATRGLPWQQRPPTRCPLLKEDNRCAVYDLRPLACRGFTSADAEPCRAWAEGRPTPGAPVDVMRHTVANGIAKGLADGVESKGLDGTSCDLPVALVIALETPDVEARWAVGERVFAGAAAPRSDASPFQRHLPVLTSK